MDEPIQQPPMMVLNRRSLITMMAAAAALPAAVAGATSAAAASGALSALDQQDIRRAEQLLDGITSLKARFTQVDSNGGVATGTFYLRRPGRMRFEYDAPSPLLMVADGTWLVVYDKEIKQVDRYPLGATPIGVLARERVRLDQGVELLGVVRDKGAFGIKLTDQDHRDEGQLILIFTDSPLEFRQWQVLDAQGATTVFTLDRVQTGLALSPSLFVFQDPPGTTLTRHDRG